MGGGGRGVMIAGRRHDCRRFGDAEFEGASRKSGESCATGREQGSMRERMRRRDWHKARMRMRIRAAGATFHRAIRCEALRL